MDKPNILLLISHDTGRQLGCYGRDVQTPEIDRLAQEGVRFDRYFCPQPQCSPSRGSILTGLYAHNHGMMGLAHREFRLKEGSITLPKILTKAGYETTLVGLHHEGIEGAEKFGTVESALGYQRVEKTPEKKARHVADQLNAFLQEKATTRTEQPFYVSAGFWETHRPFDDYESVDELSVTVPPYLPDTPEVRRDIAQFQGSLKALDQAIGSVMQTLQETGLAENTLVIYTTDHGIAFPRAKGTLFDPGLETALIMRWPQGFSGGRVQQEMLCNVDLMPTVLDLVDIDTPAGLDGRSFAAVLRGERFQPRNHFFCELTWHDRYHPMRGIRTERHKYIRNLIDGPSVYLPLDIHRSLSAGAVRDAFYVPNSTEELYDLAQDPLETNNLANDDRFEPLLEELRDRVLQWMRETNDPILRGPVPGTEAPGWEEERRKGTTYIGRP